MYFWLPTIAIFSVVALVAYAYKLVRVRIPGYFEVLPHGLFDTLVTKIILGQWLYTAIYWEIRPLVPRLNIPVRLLGYCGNYINANHQIGKLLVWVAAKRVLLAWKYAWKGDFDEENLKLKAVYRETTTTHYLLICM